MSRRERDAEKVRYWERTIRVATISAAEEGRPLVAHQLAAAVGENGPPIDQARPLLLAAPGREPSDQGAVWGHAVQDRGATLASGIGEPQTGSVFGDEGGRGRKSV